MADRVRRRPAVTAASPRRAASACSRASREEISVAARMAPTKANPAPTRNAFWKPSVSAVARPTPSDTAELVAPLATATRIARPRAPPTCWAVFTSPDASPAWSGRIPVTAAIVTGTNAKPSPMAARMEGKSTSPT